MQSPDVPVQNVQDVDAPPTLPVEITEKIYIESENLNFPLTNRHLYQMLNNEFTGLYFSSHIFSHPFTYIDHSYSHEITSPDLVAGIARDREVISTQTILINKLWFNASFARRLEAMTPALQMRAKHRRDMDSEWSDPMMKLILPNTPSLTIPHRNSETGAVEMPDRLLKRPWTDEKVDLFRRLRGWCIDPRSPLNASPGTAVWSAWEQAKDDGQEEMVELLDVYMEAGVMMRRYSEEYPGCGQPLPDLDDPDL